MESIGGTEKIYYFLLLQMVVVEIRTVATYHWLEEIAVQLDFSNPQQVADEGGILLCYLSTPLSHHVCLSTAKMTSVEEIKRKYRRRPTMNRPVEGMSGLLTNNKTIGESRGVPRKIRQYGSEKGLTPLSKDWTLRHCVQVFTLDILLERSVKRCLTCVDDLIKELHSPFATR